MLLSDTLILLISQLQTQQMMTLQIRPHIDCLIQTYYILMLILQSRFVKKCSHNGEF